MLTVGLNNRGLLAELEIQPRVLLLFLLAVACKSCSTDQETGCMLYEMMCVFDVYCGQFRSLADKSSKL